METNGEATTTMTDKPEKKRKKKGWKGWALVIEDEQGNVLEINDGPAPAPLVRREKKSAPVEEQKAVVKSKYWAATLLEGEGTHAV
jgi:hypothetical protein